jgi:hypothetical protein
MKAAINLVGVSYSTSGRIRNFNESFESLKKNIEAPIREKGYDIDYFLTTYDNDKKEDILKLYNPVKSTFLDSNFNKLGGGDVINSNGKNMLIMVHTYLESLKQLKQQTDIDLVVSTRFDILFNVNPFNDFNYDLSKFNFLFRDYIYLDHPFVIDTFYVFPFNMIDSLIQAIHDMIDNPYKGVTIAMLNLHNPLSNIIGLENINIACGDEIHRGDINHIYDLKRTT